MIAHLIKDNKMKQLSLENLLAMDEVVSEIFGDELHKKRCLSLSQAAMGLLAGESLVLHRMGEGLSQVMGGSKKHATKQIDRLLSNKGIKCRELSKNWARYMIGQEKALLVALDWSAFADDKQSMLSLNVVSSKGLSIPLLWKSVDNSRIKYNRARYEDELLSELKAILPEDVTVTVLADRGFSDHKFLRFLSEELNFNYVIRIKGNTTIIHEEKKQKAVEHLEKGQIVTLNNVGITLQNYSVPVFVATQDKGMKAPWYLVSNLPETGRELVRKYAKRWKIEPYFRDLKDGRYGYGMESTHYKSAERRDRLMLIVVLCYRLLVLLGQAGEQIGFDKKLKVNTAKKRTHSLFRQGLFYYEFFPHFKPDEQHALLLSFQTILAEVPFWVDLMAELK
jgi:hypothetical protein